MSGDLITRLEGATEGGRELDEDISAALIGATLEVQSDGRRAWHCVTHWVSIEPVKPWTSSLDAALKLVPEGCRYEIEQSVGGGWFDAYVYQIGQTDEFLGDTPAGVKTAALAVCIAALKARSSAEMSSWR